MGTRYEGGGAESADSEDWTKMESGARPAKDAGVETGLENSDQDAPEAAADASVPVGTAEAGGANGDPDPGTRRYLWRYPQEEPRGRQRQRHLRRRQVMRGAAPLVSDDGEALGGSSTAAAKAAAAATVTRRRTAAGGWGWGWSGRAEESATAVKIKERIRRLERGAELWGGTYVPPIEPRRRQALSDKWSGGERDDGKAGAQLGGRRILYVITSFDRGKRLGRDYKQIDKLDYILMMMDEMREACEVRHWLPCPRWVFQCLVCWVGVR